MEYDELVKEIMRKCGRLFYRAVCRGGNCDACMFWVDGTCWLNIFLSKKYPMDKTIRFVEGFLPTIEQIAVEKGICDDMVQELKELLAQFHGGLN